MERKIDDVVQTLRTAKAQNRKVSVLIGAGCSVSAGIPTADGIVKLIKEDLNLCYERARTKTYAECMSELSPDERHSLIGRLIDDAKINWGHIALAQLMKAGYVNRVLTTNFDSLYIRASALIGQFPAVYDLASSKILEPEKIPDKAVFYLHGQRNGFVLINTPEEYEKHSKLIKPLFRDARHRVWLVVGYSGENDPLFDQIIRVKKFDSHLFWMGYKENPPAAHVETKLLTTIKGTFFVPDYDSDEFFVTMAQMLNCFPPKFIGKPFSFLEDIYDSLTTYTLPKTNNSIDSLKYARKYVNLAKEALEEIHSDVLEGYASLLRGDFKKAIALKEKYPDYPDSEIKDLVAWGYTMFGNELFNQAKHKIGKEANQKFKEACEKYAEAVEIKPEKPELLFNWGAALSYQAIINTGKEADYLYREAFTKYLKAVKLRPSYHEALHNWGTALASQARTKTGKESDRIFRESYKKYADALKYKPDYLEAINNWGSTLFEQARTKEGEEADQLYTSACEKFEIAFIFKPDRPETLNNWGLALSFQAKIKHIAEADFYYIEAYKKFAIALQLWPNYHEALFNWGNALSSQAKTKERIEADYLFIEACEKYLAAEEIKKDDHQVLNNWGAVLNERARIKNGEEANHLYREGISKFVAALKVRPDMDDAYYNWGVALTEMATTKKGEEADSLLKEAAEKYLESNKHNKGSAAYNLASVYSMLHQEQDCEKWLNISRESGDMPELNIIQNDSTFNFVRNTTWFKKILERLD